ncbi:IS21 family transposase [Slackia exigua]|uniref:IS21 family transposase n=1 Tax=Slackia exigua TaxID=84109 RepID=UPI00200453DF|nr:IS21 family transposase [Slackia exigua]MCK6139745.1 IS21 family transposase [Slackia exigua]
MVKYREILRLASMGTSQESIAFSCKCAQSTVPDVLRAARVRKLSWPLPEEMDDSAIRAVIYPRESRKSRDKAAIDHERVSSELMWRGITMSLLWNEYCDGAIVRGEEPYMYSAFCREHREWAQRHDVRMRIKHKPAESIQVDWVDDTGEVIDPDTGEALKAYVFAACLPYSNHLYAEGFCRTDEEAWVTAHVRMFSFFGGSTPILVPDNCKTAITRNAKEALIVNDQYRRMSERYGCAVVPARVRRPRDKASVGMGVGVIERQAMMALRKRRFMSLSDFNAALIAQVMAVNSRPFQKREGSREGIFLGQESPARQALRDGHPQGSHRRF